MVGSSQECSPLCKSFRCDKQPSSYKVVRKGSQKVAWCTWIDEECDGAWCQFAKCQERRMLDNGTCKPRVRPLLEVDESTREEEYPDSIPKEYAKKLRGRL